MEGPRPAETGEDPLAPYRGRILYGLASAAAVCLLPFSVNAFVQGNPWLGVGILCAFLVLGIDALAIYLKKSPPIPLILLLVPIAVGTAVSLKVQGFFGALWAYPTVLLFTFSLSRRLANAGNILLLLIISALVYHYIDPAYTIRFFVTLTLTIILANIVLSIIVDLHRRLLDQALVDPLTGVFNRRYMERCLSDAIERLRRNSAPTSLLLIDVDRFKSINDQFAQARPALSHRRRGVHAVAARHAGACGRPRRRGPSRLDRGIAFARRLAGDAEHRSRRASPRRINGLLDEARR